MRANIITAPVFPGDAADGWVGFREKNIPWHFRH
jgi:hypothetical protein